MTARVGLPQITQISTDEGVDKIHHPLRLGSLASLREQKQGFSQWRQGAKAQSLSEIVDQAARNAVKSYSSGR